MSKGIAGTIKPVNALYAAALNGASTTHKFFPVNPYHKVLFHVLGTAASIANAVTMTCQTMQATSAAGGGAKVVTNNVAVATVPAGVVAANITLLNAAATNAITINGLTFTGAAATTLSKREFIASGNDAADCTALISCINDATYGVPGVTAAEGAADSIDLTVSEPGEATITITDANGVFTTIATAMEALVEVDLGALDIAGGFDHVGLRVTNSAAITTCVTAIFDARYAPLHNVAAEKYDCEA